jgi:hypothetical protein
VLFPTVRGPVRITTGSSATRCETTSRSRLGRSPLIAFTHCRLPYMPGSRRCCGKIFRLFLGRFTHRVWEDLHSFAGKHSRADRLPIPGFVALDRVLTVPAAPAWQAIAGQFLGPVGGVGHHPCRDQTRPVAERAVLSVQRPAHPRPVTTRRLRHRRLSAASATANWAPRNPSGIRLIDSSPPAKARSRAPQRYWIAADQIACGPRAAAGSRCRPGRGRAVRPRPGISRSTNPTAWPMHPPTRRGCRSQVPVQSAVAPSWSTIMARR